MLTPPFGGVLASRLPTGVGVLVGVVEGVTDGVAEGVDCRSDDGMMGGITRCRTTGGIFAVDLCDALVEFAGGGRGELDLDPARDPALDDCLDPAREPSLEPVLEPPREGSRELTPLPAGLFIADDLVDI